MATAYERREYTGAATDTTLSGDITPTTTTIVIANATGWPTGAVGPFSAVIDFGTSTEEKIQVQSRTSTTLTLAGTGDRGRDGTTAVSHTSGAPIAHVGIARDMDEANIAVVQTVGKVTTAEDMIVASGANAFKRLAKGTDDQILTMVAGVVAWSAPPDPEGFALQGDLDSEISSRETADTLLNAGLGVVGDALDTHAAETDAHGGPYLGATADAGGDLAGSYPDPTLANLSVQMAHVGTNWASFAATKTALSVAAATETLVTFTTGQENWRVGFSHTSGNAEFFVGRDCYLNVSAWAEFASSVYDNKEINVQIRHNGIVVWKQGDLTNGAHEVNYNAHGPVKVSAGDSVTCVVYQDTGGALDCNIRFAATFAGNWE